MMDAAAVMVGLMVVAVECGGEFDIVEMDWRLSLASNTEIVAKIATVAI